MINKPVVGMSIYATEKHPTRPANVAVGTIVEVTATMLTFRNAFFDNESIIWKFEDGLNKFFTWGK